MNKVFSQVGNADVATDPVVMILIVDDDQAVRDSMNLLLSGAGFTTMTAAGGKEALACCEVVEYPVILLDLQMPEFNGQQVLAELQKGCCHSKIVVVSGETSFEAVRASLQQGAYDFVRKPYLAEELLTTVRNALESYRLEREHDRVERALRESEQLHRYIVNNSPDFVYVLNRDGYFTFINDTAEALLGFKREELIGRHFSELICEEDLALARHVFNERRTGMRASRNVEMRLKIKVAQEAERSFDTHLLPIELSAVGMYNSGHNQGSGIFVGTYGCARDMTERKRSEALINFQAYHDLLTSLPNRALFEDRLGLALAHAQRYNQSLAVLFIDLDRFKRINDSFGHSLGDRVLQLVAERIQGCLRAEDTLSRFGGDEFTLLLPKLDRDRDASIVAEKILKRISAPYLVDGHELFLSASIGIALYPDAGETRDALLRAADVAMYHVKGEGKNGFAFYHKSMTAGWGEHLSLERDLRRAIEVRQFEVFFQPKVDTETHRIAGMEALIRWRHPERGLVYPDQFIPLAEETRLIVPIGNWVFRQTCAEMRRWKKEGLASVRVSVNISAIQIEQPDFVKRIIETLEEFEISAAQIEIEVTEYGLMKNREAAARNLGELSRYGVSVAVDDFGTGYSSLSYLQQFPVNTLKIDKSFVWKITEEETDTCLVDAIVSMGRGLRLHMIAEGVETEAQLDYLRKIGCREVQGHLFCAAQSAPQTLELLRSGTLTQAPSCTLENFSFRRFP